MNISKQTASLVVCSVVSAAAGAAATYLYATNVLAKKFEERLTEEIADAKAFYQEMYSTPVFEPDESDEVSRATNAIVKELDSAVEDKVGQALDAMRMYSPEESSVEEDSREPVVVNVFQNHVAPGEEVLAALMRDRKPDEPYIITREEFYANEPDYEQKQFTYWEGDGVLVDDDEELNPIDNTDRVAGDENLLRFGYGSGDENVVYVRNETIDPPMDLHITKSSGKYSIEVLAMDDGPHLQHSQPRKFRIRDE